ncbi:hypothetical protein DLS43_14085 [Staphylococcus pseudintermedius]|nr:hypothetical protein DLS43_14085 [Staphylococcus pseudintermedius]
MFHLSKILSVGKSSILKVHSGLLCGPWTSVINIAWELVRNAESQSWPQTYWDFPTDSPDWNLNFNKISRGYVCMLKFEKHCCRQEVLLKTSGHFLEWNH